MMVLRIHGEDLVFPTALHHQVGPRIPQMNMMKVHIPFTFKLVETSKSSYSGKFDIFIYIQLVNNTSYYIVHIYLL